jgi:MFS family permease
MKNGFISALPYLLQAVVGWFVGYFADKISRTRKYRVSTIRKLCNTIGFLGPALCLYGVTVAKCDHFWNVIFLILAMGFNGFVFSGFNLNHIDLSPIYAGSLMGITNCIANFSGVLAPYVVGLILQDKNSPILDLWSSVFYLSCSVYMITSIIFVIFGSAELQLWNNRDLNSVPTKDNELCHQLNVCESNNCDQYLNKNFDEITKLK